MDYSADLLIVEAVDVLCLGSMTGGISPEELLGKRKLYSLISLMTIKDVIGH